MVSIADGPAPQMKSSLFSGSFSVRFFGIVSPDKASFISIS